MTQKMFFYLALALLMAVPMVLAWLLPVRLMVGVLAVTQLLTLIIVGAVIQQFNSREHDEENS